MKKKKQKTSGALLHRSMPLSYLSRQKEGDKNGTPACACSGTDRTQPALAGGTGGI